MPGVSLTEPPMPGSAHHGWEPGPLHPRLAEGAVHVWRADLTAVSDDLIEVLSPDERARAERFLRARDGQLWARAHGVLRVLLGRYLEADPRMLRFGTGEHGKPALLDDSAQAPAKAGSTSGTPAGLSFNLSHSGHVALYGFTRTGPIGVDVEVARRSINEPAIAERAFGPAEARRLNGLDETVREREFLRRWTRHEAELKRRGTGIGGASAEADQGEPWFAELEMEVQARAAIAVEQQPRELRCWGWREVTGRPRGRRSAGRSASRHTEQ